MFTIHTKNDFWDDGTFSSELMLCWLWVWPHAVHFHTSPPLDACSAMNIYHSLFVCLCLQYLVTPSCISGTTTPSGDNVSVSVWLWCVLWDVLYWRAAQTCVTLNRWREWFVNTVYAVPACHIWNATRLEALKWLTDMQFFQKHQRLCIHHLLRLLSTIFYPQDPYDWHFFKPLLF